MSGCLSIRARRWSLPSASHVPRCFRARGLAGVRVRRRRGAGRGVRRGRCFRQGRVGWWRGGARGFDCWRRSMRMRGPRWRRFERPSDVCSMDDRGIGHRRGGQKRKKERLCGYVTWVVLFWVEGRMGVCLLFWVEGRGCVCSALSGGKECLVFRGGGKGLVQAPWTDEEASQDYRRKRKGGLTATHDEATQPPPPPHPREIDDQTQKKRPLQSMRQVSVCALLTCPYPLLYSPPPSCVEAPRPCCSRACSRASWRQRSYGRPS